MSYVVHHHSGLAATATATYVAIGPVDISNLDKFVIVYRNNNSAGVSLVHGQVDCALEPSLISNATGNAPVWFSPHTAIISVPSALAPSAITATSAVENVYKFLRIQIRTSTTMTAGSFQVSIAGFQRFK